MKEIGEYVQELRSKGHLLFQNKHIRDDVARNAGRLLGTDRVSRSSVKNQQVHPEYIADYAGSFETGFGNTMYKTFFTTLYILEYR